MAEAGFIDPRTPVLVGAAQFTQKVAPEQSLTGLGMVEQAARAAFADTSAAGIAAAVDTVLVVGFTVDAPDFPLKDLARPSNPPKSLSKALGLTPAREIYTHMGGNTPQMAVNRLAEEIAQGRCETALLAGAEFLNSYMKLMRVGADMSAWAVDDGTPAEVWGDPRPGNPAVETAHGLNYPTNAYPLFENAIRHRRGVSLGAHMQSMGRLFSPFSKVASANPLSWFPTYRSPEEIATVTPDNRMIGFPYTKYMNAVIQVDQMAALVITSVAKARELGIGEDKWVFLHGCADATDVFHLTERADFISSPAIRGMGKRAFDMAGWSVRDVDFIDLYSCFPSAVEIGCQELGIAEDDPRGLTVTGGLPYFGGPGNNYTMHSIATMMDKLKAARASSGTHAKGLLTGNGWFVTKHSMGLYSTEPVRGPWTREAPAVLQAELDAMDHPVLDPSPTGRATVESFTIVHGRDAIRMAIVVGRLEGGQRFVAHTPHHEALYQRMMTQGAIGMTGTVTPSGDGQTILFTPD